MRLTVLGRSPARPNPNEACAGYLVEGGGARILVDIGPGVVAQLLRHHEPGELDAIVVSHMHSDHLLDLVTLRYSYEWGPMRPDQRLPVTLPPGSADQLLDLAKGAGSKRHFEDVFALSEHDGSGRFAIGGLSLAPIATQHYVPCWGFRMEAEGQRLAYTADTAPCDALYELATDADLLLAEATLRSLDEDAQSAPERGHLLPSEAAAAARVAGSKRLVLTHIPVDLASAPAIAEASELFGSPVEVAEPSRTYEI